MQLFDILILLGNLWGSFTILSRTSELLFESKGKQPKTIIHKIIPKAQISIFVDELYVNPEAS